MSTKVWFFTGSSRGFGRVWADAALKRGDKVAATARTVTSIADLKEKYGANVLTLQLDVTKPDQVRRPWSKLTLTSAGSILFSIMPAIHLSV